MTTGYPTKSGDYWARLYEWNGKNGKYDIKDEAWVLVHVDTDWNIESQMSFFGNDVLYDVRLIYEYKEVESPE